MWPGATRKHFGEIMAWPLVLAAPWLWKGALMIGGFLASGWLAGQIGNAFEGAGRNQAFNTVDEVADDLRNMGRYDLAYQLAMETARGNTAAFTVQAPQETGIGGLLGDVREILPLALLGFFAVKFMK